jgi:hypothetical protein
MSEQVLPEVLNYSFYFRHSFLNKKASETSPLISLWLNTISSLGNDIQDGLSSTFS